MLKKLSTKPGEDQFRPTQLFQIQHLSRLRLTVRFEYIEVDT